MRTLRDEGLDKVKKGLTSIEEVMMITASDYDDLGSTAEENLKETAAVSTNEQN